LCLSNPPRKTTLVKEARGLTNRAASENRNLTDEEVSPFDTLRSRVDSPRQRSTAKPP